MLEDGEPGAGIGDRAAHRLERQWKEMVVGAHLVREKVHHGVGHHAHCDGHENPGPEPAEDEQDRHEEEGVHDLGEGVSPK